MNRLFYLLQKVPFLAHINHDEFEYFKDKFDNLAVPAGKTFNLKNDNNLYIVQNGYLEVLSSTGKREAIFLPSGSFLGAIPFVENIPRGNFKAVIDTLLLVLDIKLLYRLFFESYKFSRGYIKSIVQNKLKLNNSGFKYFDKKTKIITITSNNQKCGKTLISSYIAAALENYDKTILLDLSYKGDSLFNLFNKKLTLAISQREKADNSYHESFIKERICQISENLSILNVSFAAKVKMDPDIISPIIFILSNIYKYIVIDLGGDDIDILKSVYNCSDIIFPILNKAKNIPTLYDQLDCNLNEGQKVIYLINNFYAQNIKKNDDKIVFPSLKIENNNEIYSQLKKIVNKNKENNYFNIINKIVEVQRAFILNSNNYSDIAYGGLLNILFENDYNVHSIHASFVGYIIAIFYLISRNSKEFTKFIGKFFKAERLKSLMNIVFPSEYIFENDKLNKYTYDIFKNIRIENYEIKISGVFMNNHMQKRIFSTGYINKLFTASFLLYPLCKSFNIAGQFFHSGFPYCKATDTDLLRTDVDEIIFCNIQNTFADRKNKKNSNLINNYLAYFNFGNNNFITQKKLIIDATFGNNNVNDLIEKNEEKWLVEIEKNNL